MASPFRLSYVTDVEGNLDYFHAFVKLSEYLDYDGEGVLKLADQSFFVFGGDIVDKGLGDERLCRQLVALKQKHPDRVFLLVGNRDLNKVCQFLPLLSTRRKPLPCSNVSAFFICCCAIIRMWSIPFPRPVLSVNGNDMSILIFRCDTPPNSATATWLSPSLMSRAHIGTSRQPPYSNTSLSSREVTTTPRCR
jgi:hypothetical protein